MYDLIDAVVEFFARGGNTSGYIGVSELSSREYTPEEEADLVAFLRALDGPGPPPELLSPPQ